MGVAAADVEGRLAASVGELDAVAPDFTPALDVPNGGLLCALPALLAVGLLEGVERHLQLPKGYYGLDSMFLLLPFMEGSPPGARRSRAITATAVVTLIYMVVMTVWSYPGPSTCR